MMASSDPIQSGDIPPSGEILAMRVLIAHQKTNIRLLGSASAVMFILSVTLFVVLYLHNAIKELGPALGNLLTFVSSLFPITGVVAANNRIGELKAASLLASRSELTAHEEDLLKELLKK